MAPSPSQVPGLLFNIPSLGDLNNWATPITILISGDLKWNHYTFITICIKYKILGGGTFSKSLVFQAISNVVVIGHDIFALLLCQFFNLGPHPAKLLFGFFSFFGPNKPTGRKCCSGIMSNFFNFLNLFWHYYLIGNIQDHFGAIQTPSRHP